MASGGLEREWRLAGGWAMVEGLPPGDWRVAVATPDGRSWTGRAAAPAAGGSVQLTLE